MDVVEAAKLGTTVISGGYIISDLLVTDNIVTGTLTGITIAGNTITTNASGTGLRVQMSAGAAGYVKFYSGNTSPLEREPAKIYVLDGGGDPESTLRLIGATYNVLDFGSVLEFLSNSSTAHDHTIQMYVDGSGDKESPQLTMDSLTDLTEIAGDVSIPRLLLSRASAIKFEHEFSGPTAMYAAGTPAGGDFWCVDVGGGLAATMGAYLVPDAGASHPGVVRFRSANGGGPDGRGVLTGSEGVQLQNEDFIEFCFKFTDTQSSVYARCGTFNSAGSTAPSAGAWIGFEQGNGSTIRAYGFVDSYKTSGYASITEGVWYRGRIDHISGGVTFTMFTAAGTPVTWSNNTIYATPTGANYFGLVNYNTAATNVYIGDWDYMGCYLGPRSR